MIKPQLLTDEYTTTGVLLPDEEVDFDHFETSGKVIEINFEEGTPVKKGQLTCQSQRPPATGTTSTVGFTTKVS